MTTAFPPKGKRKKHTLIKDLVLGRASNSWLFSQRDTVSILSSLELLQPCFFGGPESFFFPLACFEKEK